ncbi:winged helix-turn-helix transcriptional regulator (plasmid) [Bradyrhizobium betae]|uniref:Winged helix-turn-helix transcriptional regulator n=1 Tax=Bradyrhizobium betae TaxID=244734 RepID=A0A5P6PH58_9BRAD|nr:metalloregulator ArsR/SmtB family transcription factor [Bradyrhizobium betae]QFI77651.1 winged helix-turn-helix transcriptional regulator [Bradyrhizobium betae]
MSSTGPKQAIFASLAEVAQALGHVHRLELLEHIAQGERSVEQLSVRANLNFANTSRHLQILRRARLVETHRRGKQVLYRLAGDAEVVDLMQALGRVGERNVAEVERVMADYFPRPRRSGACVTGGPAARLRDGLVTVLDVRPEEKNSVVPACTCSATALPSFRASISGGIRRGCRSAAASAGPIGIIGREGACADNPSTGKKGSAVEFHRYACGSMDVIRTPTC